MISPLQFGRMTRQDKDSLTYTWDYYAPTEQGGRLERLDSKPATVSSCSKTPTTAMTRLATSPRLMIRSRAKMRAMKWNGLNSSSLGKHNQPRMQPTVMAHCHRCFCCYCCHYCYLYDLLIKILLSFLFLFLWF